MQYVDKKRSLSGHWTDKNRTLDDSCRPFAEVIEAKILSTEE